MTIARKAEAWSRSKDGQHWIKQDEKAQIEEAQAEEEETKR